MKIFKEDNINLQKKDMLNILINHSLTTGEMVAEHWHDYYEILYVMEGSAIQCVNEKTQEITKCDIVLISPGDVHKTLSNCEEGCLILVILFLPQVLALDNNINSSSQYIDAFMDKNILKSCFLRKPYMFENELKKITSKINEEFTLKDVGFLQITTGLIYQLLGLIKRNIHQLDENIAIPKNYNVILEICKYIEMNYRENMSLSKIASIFGYSPEHLSRMFSATTNKSFKRFVDFVKMSEAKKLLLFTNMSVVDISDYLKFDDVSSFSRTFKRVFNMAPSKFVTFCKSDF